MKAVVHKTKGKLDLRAITVFGMNAKPTTDTPIGYFGTGLKYAVAVLTREKIPVKIYIDGKLWIVESDPAQFRGKEFTELYLCSTTIGGLIKKRIKLPFTTELGKNWSLWQVFRELHSNTLDEKGETFLAEEFNDPERPIEGMKGHTLIVIEDQRYVEEFHNRDQTFLSEGLRSREGSETLQVFDKPSKSIYYRGIRILDLPKEETSQLTYNILSQIQLTEDRTAADPWGVKWIIQNYIASNAAPEIIKKAVATPQRSYESSFTYDYAQRSKEFDEVIEEIDDNEVHMNYSARSIRSVNREAAQTKVEWEKMHWRNAFLIALSRGNYTKVQEIYDDHKEDLQELLEVAEDKSADGTSPEIQPKVPSDEQSAPERNYADPVDTTDYIPF